MAPELVDHARHVLRQVGEQGVALLQPPREGVALGDVAEHRGGNCFAARVGVGRRRDLHLEGLAVATQQTQLAPGAPFLLALEQQRCGARVAQVDQAAAAAQADLRLAQAEHRAGCRVGRHDTAAGQRQHHAFHAVGIQQLVALLAFAACLLGAAERRQVGVCPREPHRATAGVAQDEAPRKHWNVVAVLVAQAHLGFVMVGPAAQRRGEGELCAGPVFGGDELLPQEGVVGHFLDAIAEHRPAARRVETLAGLQVPVPPAVVGTLQHQRHASFAGLQLLLQPLQAVAFDAQRTIRGAERRVLPAQFELRHHLARQHRQSIALRVAEAAWHAVDQAQRAYGVALGTDQRRSGIETHTALADDERVIGESRVGASVVDDHHFGAADGVVAEGDLARRLAHGQADARLEPLALAVDQAHQRYRHLEPARGQRGDLVECSLCFGVEHRVVDQRLEALRFGVRQSGRLRHGECGELEAFNGGPWRHPARQHANRATALRGTPCFRARRPRLE